MRSVPFTILFLIFSSSTLVGQCFASSRVGLLDCINNSLEVEIIFNRMQTIDVSDQVLDLRGRTIRIAKKSANLIFNGANPVSSTTTFVIDANLSETYFTVVDQGSSRCYSDWTGAPTACSDVATLNSEIQYNSATYTDPTLGGGGSTARALPVELISFDHRIIGDEIELDWQYLNQNEYGRLLLEFSTNGRQYQTLTETQLNLSFEIRNSRYSTTPSQPGTYYFRLVHRAPEGFEKVLDVQAIPWRKGSQLAAPYPNPIEAGNQLRLAVPERGNARLLTVHGKLLVSGEVSPSVPFMRIPTDLLPGIYLLQVSSSDGADRQYRIRVE